MVIAFPIADPFHSIKDIVFKTLLSKLPYYRSRRRRRRRRRRKEEEEEEEEEEEIVYWTQTIYAY